MAEREDVENYLSLEDETSKPKVSKSKLKIPLNLEIAATNEMLNIALKSKPDFICIVPEKRQELTTEGGLNLSHRKKFLNKLIKKLKKNSFRVSLFIEPSIKDIKKSQELNADCVEIHTGRFCNLVNDNKGARAEVWERGIYLGKINLTVLGNHNVSNTLAAIAVGRKIGLEFSVIVDSLLNFQSPKRRFEKRGYCNEITFIDDYAHHPSEIKATLSAARSKIDNKLANRIVVIFQPHRYSRTFTLLEKFATCFNEADLVVLTDIYSAGEINTNNIHGEDLAKEVSKNHPKVLYFPSLEDLPQKLPELLQPKDLVLFLGAGNLNQIIPHIIDLCRTSK